MTYQVAVVGTGNPEQDDRYAMAYRHAQGFQKLDGCQLVACADIVEENAKEFAQTFDIDSEHVYEDYERMLADSSPDIVSVCTPPKTHADIVTGCANTGDVNAVHCEKPMAATWKECRQMVDVCNQRDVQLTFNHQRRFADPFRKAKSILDDGRIGALRRIEVGGHDLYDYGTHLFDLTGYLTDQEPIEWALGQVDYQNPDVMYGLRLETQGLGRWHYESGVDGFVSTGDDGMIDCHLRIVGDDGVIEVGHEDGPPLRVRIDGSGWETVDTGRDGIYRPQTGRLGKVDTLLERVPFGPDKLVAGPTYVDRAIEEIVDALRKGKKSQLAAENALQTTEVIYAIWESARRGGRVELPLEIDDNPLQAMIERKESTPSP